MFNIDTELDLREFYYTGKYISDSVILSEESIYSLLDYLMSLQGEELCMFYYGVMQMLDTVNSLQEILVEYFGNKATLRKNYYNWHVLEINFVTTDYHTVQDFLNLIEYNLMELNS